MSMTDRPDDLAPEDPSRRRLLAAATGVVGASLCAGTLGATCAALLSPLLRPDAEAGAVVDLGPLDEFPPGLARKVAVLFGGNGPPSAGCNNSNICGDTWEYDGNNWAQKFPGASPSARYWTSLSYDPRGVSVLFGGYNAGCSNDTWEWDGQNWKNAAPSMSPSVRYAHHLVYDGARGRTLLFGGIDCSVSVNETWVYGGP